MRAHALATRTMVRCTWVCKHCRQSFGSEIVAHYGDNMPNIIQPTWFFAAMTLLDHLRDCRQQDHSEDLRTTYGHDFLNHKKIYEWFNVNAIVERKILSEEELDEKGHMNA